jgi:hypothetical protein
MLPKKRRGKRERDGGREDYKDIIATLKVYITIIVLL